LRGHLQYSCQIVKAPDYLSELCMPVAQVAERQHLRSASRNLLVAPRFQLNTYGRRAFAVAVPATSNSLSDELRNHLPTQLKDVSASTIPGALSALEALCNYALYKSTFTLHYILLSGPCLAVHLATSYIRTFSTVCESLGSFCGQTYLSPVV